ncbi:MAG: hypothetical protein ACREQJ_06190 [Candidatus Binatia bacterium]
MNFGIRWNRTALLAAVAWLAIGAAAPRDASALDPAFTSTFPPCAAFATTGSNRYFVLEPGWELVFEGEEDGEEVELIITVLNETLQIGGVQTRVVEERELIDGELFEVSRNFFAICTDHASVFYFGEDVEFFENGQVVSTDGSWRAGVNGALPGLQMPGLALLGARYYQEVAPGIALDKGQIKKLDRIKTVPAGTFGECLKVRETNDLELDAVESKFHAPGIGLIKDGELELVSYGFAD